MPDNKTIYKRIGGGLAVVATVLTILVSVDALKNDQPDIEVAEFAIDRPGAINANVYSMTPDNPFLEETLTNSVVDVTLRNRGNEGALITGIELLVTGHYQDQPCGAIGGDLAVSASYDFIVPENPQLPLTLTQLKCQRMSIPGLVSHLALMSSYTRFTQIYTLSMSSSVSARVTIKF